MSGQNVRYEFVFQPGDLVLELYFEDIAKGNYSIHYGDLIRDEQNVINVKRY